MIEMVIVYCLVSDTKSCTEKRLRMDSFTSLVGCTMSGQQRAQEYLREHPAYELKTWRCEMNVPRQTRNELPQGPVVAKVNLASSSEAAGPTLMPVLKAESTSGPELQDYD